MINWRLLTVHNVIVIGFALVLLAATMTVLQPFRNQLPTIGASDDGF
jgi:uncharacterized membrane protein